MVMSRRSVNPGQAERKIHYTHDRYHERPWTCVLCILSSLQCYSVLSDILIKNELCIPLEKGSNVLSTDEGSICLSSLSKLKSAVRFCSIYKKTISFSALVF